MYFGKKIGFFFEGGYEIFLVVPSPPLASSYLDPPLHLVSRKLPKMSEKIFTRIPGLS